MHESPKVGHWAINRDLNQLEIDGQAYKLRPRTMDVLAFLAERPDNVLSIDDLVAGVWKDVVVSDGSVYQAVRELRSAFETAGAACPIETIPKRGYVLKAGSLGDERAQKQPRSRLTAVRLALGAAIVAMTAGLGIWALHVADEMPSVALLPFRDLSPGSDRQYMADGMSETVILYLSRIEGLRVRGWISSIYLGRRDADLATACEQLGVQHTLDGSIRIDGDQLRVMASLSDCETGDQVWSRPYEGQLSDIIELEEKIASDVAVSIGVSLGVGMWPQIPGMTRDLEAYDELLRANAMSVSNLAGDSESVQTAINQLNRAVEIDPAFGFAWLKLAFTNTAIASGVLPGDPLAARDRARHSAERAQAIMPDSPLVAEYMGLMATIEGRWAAASEYYQRARRSESAGAWAQTGDVYYAEFLIRVGRIEEATRTLERAKVGNPLDRDIAMMLALAYGSGQQLERAFQEAERSLMLDPTLRATSTTSGLGLVALGSGDKSVIAKWLGTPIENAESIDPFNVNQVGLAYLEEPGKALELLHRVDYGPTQQAIMLATWAAYFGDPELALEAFGRGPAGVQTIVVWQLWLPIFSDMRQLPGFKDLVSDLGLVDYWRERDNWPDFCAPVGSSDFECTF